MRAERKPRTRGEPLAVCVFTVSPVVKAKEKLLDQLHGLQSDRDAMQAGWHEMKSTAEQAIQAPQR